MQIEKVYYVTILSNFARGYDKYARAYCKEGIQESTYPNEFYVLRASELSIGLEKAQALLSKVGNKGDEVIAIEAEVPSDRLLANQRNGKGRVWRSNRLPVSGVFKLAKSAELGERRSLEDAHSQSLATGATLLKPYTALSPRSISFLPIAKGCQASCPFCFSEASVSMVQEQSKTFLNTADSWCQRAAHAGAIRAVITGGGEPTLVGDGSLRALIQITRQHFSKTVLITNGYRFVQRPDGDQALQALVESGLGVLAVSCHHHVAARNAGLMRLDTKTETTLQLVSALPQDKLTTRLICVLQKGGIETGDDVGAYVGWAERNGASEVCFKELYVSVARESVYHSEQSNKYSEANQIPLSVVLAWAERAQFTVESQLPWGAPVFIGEVNGRTIRVAAYTEPSVFWERSNGVARSWNVMANGTCLASLEDKTSILEWT